MAPQSRTFIPELAARSPILDLRGAEAPFSALWSGGTAAVLFVRHFG